MKRRSYSEPEWRQYHLEHGTSKPDPAPARVDQKGDAWIVEQRREQARAAGKRGARLRREKRSKRLAERVAMKGRGPTGPLKRQPGIGSLKDGNDLKRRTDPPSFDEVPATSAGATGGHGRGPVSPPESHRLDNLSAHERTAAGGTNPAKDHGYPRDGQRHTKTR